ncbi:MAG TPA: polyribonucleotide nucleotidyltransferase, partial [Myxococcales bacterium]|nr:polyribonucleotide nucleotidyltransferase [Myxococcales bacterium]
CVLNGASVALHISDIPFIGPTACVRVARIDGELCANPTLDRLEGADINILVAVSPDGICMVEGGANFVAESDIIDALFFAHDACQPIMQCIEDLRAACGKPKREVVEPVVNEELRERVREIAKSPLVEALSVTEKLARYTALDAAKVDILSQFSEEELATSKREISGFIGDLKKDIVRHRIVDEGVRLDERGIRDVRAIKCETGILPRTHGSALFTRGETQAIALATLGTSRDDQRIETLTGEVSKEFLLHYNFPPFSVGETRFLRGPGRREIGHGALAQRGLELVLPDHDVFPYTMRIVSEVLESNGSSSMATVCSGSMALMDAGVPISAAVAGIAMGLIQEGDNIAVLSDILG